MFLFKRTTILFEIVEIKPATGFTENVLNDSSMMSNATFITKGAYSLLMKMKNIGEEE